MHNRFNWYKRVYERDGFKCVKCQSREKIDAHHIRPVTVLIRELLAKSGTNFKDDDEKLLWLIEQPEIIDENLENGMTLCRECHKKEHKNWGSHVNP